MKKSYLSYATILLISVIFFQIRFGFHTLNIYDDSWFLCAQTDFMNVYLQSLFFIRFGEFPYPSIWGYCYPSEMAPIYTNIMWPVVKFLSLFQVKEGGVLQHFGWWFLICTTLQGIGATYVFRKLGIRALLPLVCFSTMLMLTPALIDRSAHVSFYPHFLILFSLGLYYDKLPPLRKYIYFGLIVAFSTSIQPYMALMVYSVLFASLVKDVWLRDMKFFYALLALVLNLLSSLFIFYLLGYRPSDNKSLTVEGFGVYNANLTCFFNNLDKTYFPISFKNYLYEQYEGYAYFGLGAILALLICLVFFFKYRRNLLNPVPIIIFICASLLAIYSFLGHVSFGEYLVFEGSIPGIEIIENLFRTNGRFIWVLMYLVMFTALSRLSKLIAPSRWKPLVFLAIFAIQIVDVSPYLRRAKIRRPMPEAFENNHMKKLFDNNDLILMYPFYKSTYAKSGDAAYFVYNAYKSGKPITTGFYGRGNYSVQYEFIKTTNQYLNSNKSDSSWFNRVWITNKKDPYMLNALVREGHWKAYNFFDYVVFLHKTNVESIEYVKSLGGTPFTNFVNIKRFIKEHPNHLFAMVTHDEATFKLDNETKMEMKKMGMSMHELQFRQAYMAVFDEQNVWVDRRAFACLDTAITAEKWGKKIDLSLVSSGSKVKGCPKPFISINGSLFDGTKRGIHLIAIDSTNKITESYFDTFSSPYITQYKKD